MERLQSGISGRSFDIVALASRWAPGDSFVEGGTDGMEARTQQRALRSNGLWMRGFGEVIASCAAGDGTMRAAMKLMNCPLK